MLMHFKISPLPNEINSWLISLLQLSCERAVTGGTHDGESCTWARWEKYCLSIGCQDIFIDSLSKQEQIVLLGAFAMAVRRERFSDSLFNTLAEGTVRGTISNVVQTFQSTGRQNPTKDVDNELSILLSRLFRAFRNDNPNEKQHKALPFAVLNELAKCQVTETDKSITQPTIGAAFFACRSCEYSKVPRQEQKRMRLLCLRNVRFFRDGLLMPTQSDDLESVDSIAITFKMQKNDLKHDTVIHGRTDDSVLCPVLQWAFLVNRIWTYPGASLDTPVCTAQFGEMVAWNTLSPNLSCNTCDWRAVHMEALILASNLTKWVLTRYNQEQRWKCISEKFPFKPSCSSAGG